MAALVPGALRRTHPLLAFGQLLLAVGRLVLDEGALRVGEVVLRVADRLLRRVGPFRGGP